MPAPVHRPIPNTGHIVHAHMAMQEQQRRAQAAAGGVQPVQTGVGCGPCGCILIICIVSNALGLIFVGVALLVFVNVFVGAGVAALGVILIVVGIVLCCYMRRKMRTQTAVNRQSGGMTTQAYLYQGQQPGNQPVVVQPVQQGATITSGPGAGEGLN